MSRTLRLILTALLVMAALTGCHRNGRIIPKGTLESIYTEMFIADQWLKQNDDARRRADTTLFYEPIFRRHGYTSKDFDATISHYIDRPDKFVKILQRSAKTLNTKYLETNKIAERIQKIKADDRKGYGYVVSDFLNADSILWGSTVLDSLLIRDSLYIKPEQPDSLAVADTLAQTEIIVTTEIINVTGRDGIRPHKKQAPGQLPRD